MSLERASLPRSLFLDVTQRSGAALRDIQKTAANFEFWSHLGCSGQNAITFSREGIV